MSEISPETKDELMAELFAGRKIAAIKIYREVTGLGLAEAKEFVDSLEKRLREEVPEKFNAPKSAGCSSVILFALCSLGTLSWVLFA